MLNFDVLLDKVSHSLITEDNNDKEKYEKLQKELDELEVKIKKLTDANDPDKQDEINKLQDEIVKLEKEQQDIVDKLEIEMDKEEKTSSLSSETKPASMTQTELDAAVTKQDPDFVKQAEERVKKNDERLTIIIGGYNYLKKITNNFELGSINNLLPPPQGETPEYKEILETANTFMSNEIIARHKRWLTRLITPSQAQLDRGITTIPLPYFGLYVNMLVMTLMNSIITVNKDDMEMCINKLQKPRINAYFKVIGDRIGVKVEATPKVQKPIIPPKPKIPISPERQAVIDRLRKTGGLWRPGTPTNQTRRSGW